jgi:membrane-bound lytic murein transglycosylase D
MNSRVRSFILPFLLLAALAWTGCAAHRPRASASPPPAPEVRPPPVDGTGSDLSGSDPVAEAILSARAHLELGRQLYASGQMLQARAELDRAIEELTRFPEGARSEPRLADAYADMLAEIQAIEASSYQNGSGLGPLADLPDLEELAEIEPEISPESAAEDRELLAGAAITTDIPVILNEKVLAWLDIHRYRMHDRFQEGLTRSGRYIDMIRRIFREEGLPQDLAYMAHVESAYKPTAYSRARAKGVWQFIAGTGSRYGLRRDWWIDERSDPELATRAAAAYLRDLYGMFGDWYLAMAGYNAGEGKILRAINATGKKDFWAIATTSRIRLETKNYVPAILAALLISKDPEKFGFTSVKDPPILYDSVAIDSATDLRVIAKLAETSVDTLKLLNPALARLQTPPNYPDFEVHVPLGAGEAFATKFAAVPATERIPWSRHKVSRGETLASLSRRYGVSVARIREANGLGKSAVLKVGAELTIPTYAAPAAGGHGDLARMDGSPTRRAVGEKLVHRVHRGDTLSSIARRYKTTVEALRTWNRISPSAPIHPGDRIVAYYGRRSAEGSASRSDIARRSPASAPKEASLSGAGAARGSRGSAGAVSYKVRRGDTLHSIASRLSTTVELICQVNNISATDTIFPGMTLKIQR